MSNIVEKDEFYEPQPDKYTKKENEAVQHIENVRRPARNPKEKYPTMASEKIKYIACMYGVLVLLGILLFLTIYVF